MHRRDEKIRTTDQSRGRDTGLRYIQNKGTNTNYLVLLLNLGVKPKKKEDFLGFATLLCTIRKLNTNLQGSWLEN
jgi:hypothetical protein